MPPKSMSERKSLKGPPHHPFKGKKGSGERFKKCVGEVGRKGARDPKAVCAAIGRSKFGKKGMAKMAARGRR
jgi:hypothetical protein